MALTLITKDSNNRATLTPSSTTSRIIAWNRERNGLKFNIDLESQMLTEEANEFYMAEHLVDKVDAWADFVFVGVGTVAKWLAVKVKAFEDLEDYSQWMETVTDWMDYQRGTMLEMLLEDMATIFPGVRHNTSLFEDILNQALIIVVDANEQKGTEKDENGKVKKPEGFIRPETRLNVLLKKYLGDKYVEP